MKKIIIAIDGVSSTGKSTMARQLASRIGYRYVDSGAMYRAVTLYAIEHGLIAGDGTVDVEALNDSLGDIKIDFMPMGDGQHTLLNGIDVESEIRSLRVSQSVSLIAAIPVVRHALVDMQRNMGRERAIVMDGRDIGTTVFPDAELKVYVDASPEVRAHRRLAELRQKGDMNSTFDEVLANVIERDHIDRTRKESPLRQADDAIMLHNDNLTREEQLDWLIQHYKRVMAEETVN